MSSTDELERNLYEIAANEVLNRYSFDTIVNLIGPPQREQILAGLEDALAEMNSIGPETSFTIHSVMVGSDTRWKRFLYKGAAKNVMAMMSVMFATSSYAIDIGELKVDDRLSEIKDMADKLNDEFISGVEKLKVTSQRFAKGIKGTNSYATIRFGRSQIFQRYGGYRAFFSR